MSRNRTTITHHERIAIQGWITDDDRPSSLSIIAANLLAAEKYQHTPRLTENLRPGVVALHHAAHHVVITRRLLGTDPTSTMLNINRSSSNAQPDTHVHMSVWHA